MHIAPHGRTALAHGRCPHGLEAELSDAARHSERVSREYDLVGVVRRALHRLDLAVLVDLVINEGEPAKRLGELARREDAALLAVGAPSGDAASRDGVVAVIRLDSQVPVMVVAPCAVGFAEIGAECP
jgi:hypothetical protein